jgi:hypothetical protein
MRAKSMFVMLSFAWVAAEAQAGTKVLLRVESMPDGALVSVFSPDEKKAAQLNTVAGVTPLEKKFKFGKRLALTLTLEKRGYEPRTIEITPASGTVQATLDRIQDNGQPEISDHALPQSGALLLVPPEMQVIKRGFSSEGVDPDVSRVAESALLDALQSLFGKDFHVTLVKVTPENQQPLKSLWRDARTAMQMTDPIRLPYLARPPLLETSSSRKAAAFLGQSGQGEYLLLVAGKQVRDTSGMKLGQLAVLSAGTASSYASGYVRAMENNDSFFLYNIYTPDFASGLILKASLIDAATGEVLWINRGNWKSIRFDEVEAVNAVLKELFAGLLRSAIESGG